MKIRYLGTAAAEGWPALFCSCPICTHARIQGGKNLRTRTQAILDGELLIDFPPDTYCHALQYGLELAKIHTLPTWEILLGDKSYRRGVLLPQRKVC